MAAKIGLTVLKGKRITVFCAVYIYTGDLVAISNSCIQLKNPAIVYETGAFDDKKWKDAQALTNDLYIQLTSIESFGILK